MRNTSKNLITIRPQGISMYPCLQENDLVIIDKNLAQLDVGDIVLFEGEKHKILHRVVEMKPHYIITKGDFNSQNDVPIQFAQIEGKVISVLRKNASVDFSKVQSLSAWQRFIINIKRKFTLKFSF
jgi:signal peptidase I